MTPHVLPVTLTRPVDRAPSPAEVHLGRLRSQVAVVRALADAVECLARPGAEGMDDQLIEEMARLGCRLLESAGALAGKPRPGDSAIFERRPWPAR
jgi:hypothetical protein